MIWMKRRLIRGFILVIIVSIGSACAHTPNRSNSDLKTTNPPSRTKTSIPVKTISSSSKEGKKKSDPNMKPIAIRGIIEGFYGTPWSDEERKNMFQFMEREKLNTYVYAPKDDPFQRLDWRSPYPPAKLSKMRNLVTEAQKNKVQFVYSISPGMTGTSKEAMARSITYSSSSDQKTLESKIDQLRSIGITTFLLSFDDIKTKLKPVDQKNYGANYPKAQMQAANKILSIEKEKDPSFQLWFAPTSYYGLEDNSYWKTMRDTLNSNIKVIWTGKWVLNQRITGAQAQKITKLFGRKPILWDNYPVNDYTYVQYNKPQLLLGPLQGRSASLTQNLFGYISNPMIQPDASKLALETISDYLQNPSQYDPKAAWENAIETMPGITNPTLFKTFAIYNTESRLNPKGFSQIEAIIKDYQNASSHSQKQAAEMQLQKEFSTLEKLPSQLSASITDPGLRNDIHPWLTKLGDEGQGGLDALVYLNQPNQTNKKRLNTQIKRVTASNYKIGEQLISFMKWADTQ